MEARETNSAIFQVREDSDSDSGGTGEGMWQEEV